ncbi:hypothetical protein GCM10027051_04070 [Niabella terrae]
MIVVFLVLAVSCGQIELNERMVDMPRHEWRASQLAVLRFEVRDSGYQQLYFVLRHNDRFEFDKISARLIIQDTAKHPLQQIDFVAALTDSAGNWNGTAMDDLYYAKLPIGAPVLLQPGVYRFALQHLMKDDPLQHLLDVGVAIEKAGNGK